MMFNEDEKMSSVSRSSRISAKSQVIIEAQDKVIAEQGGQISDMAKEMAMMKRMLEEAGLKPVTEVAVEAEKGKGSKKRLPSGSPDGKLWDYPGTGSGTTSGSDYEDDPMDEEERVLKKPDFRKKGRAEVQILSKKAAKKARRLARAKENRLSVDAAKTKAAELPELNVKAPKNLVPVTPAIPVVLELETEPAPPSQANLYSTIAASGPGPGSGHRQEINQGPSVSALPEITPIFKTPLPDGPFKDEIVVEILSIDGRDFVGTVKPTEARRKIYEGVLGLAQDDLAGVKIGYNGGRIITYKLKQQRDIDQLYRCEYFDLERSKGQEVSIISCKIRGVRDPSKRNEQAIKPVRNFQEPYIDDGTRIVRIIGCEYRLLESEILDWLSLYGEVISEITEEPFEDEDEQGPEDRLPAIGNGTYLVRMRLKRDMPNWVPMYGRKVCLSYRGIKKQCSSCYGPHLRRFCKYEKMSLEEYADRFRVRNPYVPEQLYGKLAKFENIAEQERKRLQVATVENSSGSGAVASNEPTRTQAVQIQAKKNHQVKTLVPTSEQLKVTLRRTDGDVWTMSKPETTPNPGAALSKPLNLPTTSVADNVSSFLSGIRASFRSENVNVASVSR